MCNWLPDICHQHSQQIEFGRRQVDLFSAFLRKMAIGV